MALDFGKVAFSVSFNPTSAFPLDARSYFNSLAEAEAAAASAKPAGSTESVYYHGQTLVVVENDLATFYIIQPDGNLSSVNGLTDIKVNPNHFEYDDEGNLSLKGFDLAAIGQVLTMGPDGSLFWTTPIDTYTKEDIDKKLAAASHLNRIIVENIKEIEDNYLNADDYYKYIFMVPNGLTEGDDKYDEYIIIETRDSEDVVIGKTIEQVGSWEVNLDDYVKKTYLEANYVKSVEGSRLITETEVEQFAKGEENIIDSVSSDFTIDENKKLNLNDLSIEKIIGLSVSLNDKYNKTDGYLVTETDKQKLAALQLNGTDLEISGTVKVENVEGLDTLLESKVDESSFIQLESTVSSLQEAFNGIEDKYVTTTFFNSTVSNLNDLIASNSEKISKLDEALTWQELL